jgi:plasmid maintenance system antidote protein VapI
MDLKELMGAKKQKDVAAMIGFSPQRLSMVIKGRRPLQIEDAGKLAQVLGLTLGNVFDAYIETRRRAS